jgi:tRNA(fMet)-specific endonuclease VapC
VHARLWAHLASVGEDVGAHDRLVAATAIGADSRVATVNVRHFDWVPGLDVLPLRLAE